MAATTSYAVQQAHSADAVWCELSQAFLAAWTTQTDNAQIHLHSHGNSRGLCLHTSCSMCRPGGRSWSPRPGGAAQKQDS